MVVGGGLPQTCYMPKRIDNKTVEVYRLCAETGCDPRTVRLVLEGQGSRLSKLAIMAAAQRLGITLPRIVGAPDG